MTPMPPIIWPAEPAQVEDARADLLQLMERTSPAEVREMMRALDDAMQGAPIETVLLALSSALGEAAAQCVGQCTPEALATLAVTLQIAWGHTVTTRTKH
ncbi:hypothetical protein ACQW02_25400 [Humitalea sp. 24SJ18S-53]|uniref:hypothetical protein n=1 Tax=Humitalea sp. 24SJ18S-53 TaxID=3422307 RepID=UPI003D6648D2